jgi:hypothetical protein
LKLPAHWKSKELAAFLGRDDKLPALPAQELPIQEGPIRLKRGKAGEISRRREWFYPGGDYPLLVTCDNLDCRMIFPLPMKNVTEVIEGYSLYPTVVVYGRAKARCEYCGTSFELLLEDFNPKTLDGEGTYQVQRWGVPWEPWEDSRASGSTLGGVATNYTIPEKPK